MSARLTLDERDELVRLRRLTREMREELQLWRESRRPGLDEQCDHWRFRFGMSKALGLVLSELVAHAPAARSKDQLLEAMRPGWRDRVDGPELKIVDVRICQIRRKLEALGLPDAITTHWGFGYSLSADAAAFLRPQVQGKAA